MSTFWLYLRIQLMIFVFGIVGPIFLITYFAIQPEPDTRWMYWWGLFITAADVLIALSITQQSLKDRREGTSTGKPTTEELIEAASAKLRGPKRT
ncbi:MULTISPECIES: hypothetical protein [unclassified Mycobacterium]|uniref:hypothetical protein n=1 Tax=unclassified Mycobacterium TaxID=2642494 RepID=UPI0029C89985|nr:MULTISPECIES: hypothetical protein [unclassified Mycobacterium]